ncbi:zinc-ribbon domain-containing protein, partial [Myxococcota bacterium]|nr:zinc-ribbon domain-containing protein [Myxococcota bacterium]
MKFTCESCGAQYMIGDDKLGRRGVKVRCKKCSFVIILRPQGFDAGGADAPEAGREDGEAATGDLERGRSMDLAPAATLPPEAMAPTAPFVQGSGAPSPDHADSMLSATSSDLGLSREFAAMGFEDDHRPVEPPKKALALGLDLNRIAPPSDASSPFALGGRGGGSLAEAGADVDEQPTRAIATRELGKVPRLSDDDDEPAESTSVDQKVPFTRFADVGHDEESTVHAGAGEGSADLDGREGTDPGHESFDAPSDATSPGDGLAADAREDSAATDDGLGRGPVPDASAFDDRGTEAGSDDEPLGTTRRITYDDAVEARIAAMDKDELEDMESSLNRELAPKPAKPKDEPISLGRPAPRTSFGGALGALAAAESEDHELPPLGALKVEADPHAVPAIDAPLLDSEIKNAFDAMFSPSTTPPDRSVSSSHGSAPDHPIELFRSAAAYDDGSDRKPTRVFDIEAMQQVQAEQSLASSVSIPGHAASEAGTQGRALVALDTPEWYVAINDEQVGPMTFADVRVRWENQELSPGSLCWRQGMADWSPIKDVKELEALGDMDDRVRTVVARIEPAATADDDEDAQGVDEPPTIAMPPSVDLVPPKAPPPEPVEEEPAWRPSAASALASLAAMELDETSTKTKKRESKDDLVGAALPATSDALEKLLAGDSKSAATAFGAAEMSSSAIRPLPKRAEVVSSVSLRDPVPARAKPSYMLPLAIVAGFAFVGVSIFAGLRFMAPAQPAQSQVAQAPA